jgi:predicted 2-oxoglutarate/Fe(II)-dependent dioxygenase YbiX
VRDHILSTREFQGKIYADTLQLVRWLPGNSQDPHADSENEDGAPHPFSWREQASIIYINDDFVGGEVYFPDYDLELKPEAGMLVTFPGTTEYMHGVRPVESGVRYTIASFWATDSSKKDDTYQ